VAGFYSLLNNVILPHAAVEPESPGNLLATIKGGCASFWNIVQADYLAAYQQQSRTCVDPENMVLWKAAGLHPFVERPPTGIAQDGTFDRGREDIECRNLIWILAKITNFLSLQDLALSSDNHPGTWKELRRLLDLWYEGLPTLFQPYASVPLGKDADRSNGISASRFNRLLFTVPMCAVALQLYHFAQILLLTNWPLGLIQSTGRLRMFSQISRESYHHGKQICNIALGMNNCRAAHGKMVEPLFMAGTCLEEEDDRTVVLDLLRDIQKDAGYSAARRVRDLLSAWVERAEPNYS
jgi:hypothetical protein